MPSVRALLVREGFRYGRRLYVAGGRAGDRQLPPDAAPERLARAAVVARQRFDEVSARLQRTGSATVAPAEGPVPGEWVASDRAVPGRTVMLLHGGGFVMGSPMTHRGLAASLSSVGRAATLVPDYRLAPEHPYPAALDDVVAVYRWLLGPGGQDPARLVLAGDSAGGGLAVALALRVRDEGLPLPAGLALMSPWVDLTASGASVRTKAEADPWIDAEMIEPFGRLYAGEHARDPYVSPVFGSFDGLPPMLVHVGTEEVLRDDSRRLVAAARRDGVDASLGEFRGMWHVFHAFSRVPEARRAMREIGGFVRRVTTPADELSHV